MNDKHYNNYLLLQINFNDTPNQIIKNRGEEEGGGLRAKKENRLKMQNDRTSLPWAMPDFSVCEHLLSTLDF